MFVGLIIEILGSGQEVGRGAISVEYDGKSVLLDYGVNFDENDNPVMPLHIPPNKLEALVLTHTHLDHIGGAPLLYSSITPRAFATSFTMQAARMMLEDFLKLSGYYLDFEATEINRLLESITQVDFGDKIKLGEKFELFFHSSGHIPGSLSVSVKTPDGTILYTSDVNTIKTKLVDGAKFDNVEADVLIIESTYGDSDHPPRESVEKRFVDTVKEVYEKGGTVLVPVFSVGRGQEIMGVLIEHDIYPVYVDGMVRQATDVMLSNRKFLSRPELIEKAKNEYMFLKGWQDRRRVWKEPGVIVASAGMLKGGPSRYYLKKLHKEKKNAILMVSYQAPGTPGRLILEKGRYNEASVVEARVEWFDFSSHAGSSDLLGIVKSIKNLKKVILVHGEPETQNFFAERIKKEVGIDVIITKNGDKIEFSFKE